MMWPLTVTPILTSMCMHDGVTAWSDNTNLQFSVYMYNGVTTHSDTNRQFSVYMYDDVTANSDTNPQFCVHEQWCDC